MSADNTGIESISWLWQPLAAAFAVVSSWAVTAFVWLAGRSYKAEFTDRFNANEAKLANHEVQLSVLDKRQDEAETKATRQEERSANQEKQLDRLERKIDKLIELHSKS